jgi:protein-S-isoprenylcysteine O-methyltransferase Ste14
MHRRPEQLALQRRDLPRRDLRADVIRSDRWPRGVGRRQDGSGGVRARFWRLRFMSRFLLRAFGIVAYAVSIATLVTFIGFVSGVAVPKSVDDGAAVGAPAAIAADLLLVAFFGVIHSVMARASWKRVWTRYVPPAGERSLYVLIASAQIALLAWQWRPIPAPLWQITGGMAWVVRSIQALGWATLFVSSFLIDHFELFGLRQAFGRPSSSTALRTPLLYRWVRHPIYVGLLVGMWSAPLMTAGHALLSSLLTIYILVGVRHEERDLVRQFGDDYRRYQLEVPMLLPVPRLRLRRLSKGVVPE